jgi:hypothetical protein
MRKPPLRRASPSLRDQFAVARKLIDERHYDEALALLRTIDHPQARRWESWVRQRGMRRDRASLLLLQLAVVLLLIIAAVLAGLLLARLGEADSQGRAAVDAISTWIVAQTAVAQYAVAESSARLTLEAARLPNAGDTAATLEAGGATATAVVDAAQRTLQAEQAARLGGIDSPIPAGSRIEYAMGFLRVLTYESPASFVLYRLNGSTAAPAPAPAGWRYVGVELEFTCRPTAERCAAPPEADIALALQGGLVSGDADLAARDAAPLGAQPLAGGGTARGWRFFLVPEVGTVDEDRPLLRIATAQLPDGIFAALPPAVDGYTVETPWMTEADGTRQRRLPRFRRALEQQGFRIDEAFLRQPPGQAASIVFTAPVDALDAASAQALTREIGLAAAQAWAAFRDSAPGGLAVRLYNYTAGLDVGALRIAGSDLLAYLNGALSADGFIERWLIVNR